MQQTAYDVVSCTSDADLAHLTDVDGFSRCKVCISHLLSAGSRVEWDSGRNTCRSSRRRIPYFAATNGSRLAVGPDSRDLWNSFALGGDALLLVQFRPIVMAKASALVSLFFFIPLALALYYFFVYRNWTSSDRQDVYRGGRIARLEC
jgi:hypothetical protein